MAADLRTRARAALVTVDRSQSNWLVVTVKRLRDEDGAAYSLAEYREAVTWAAGLMFARHPRPTDSTPVSAADLPDGSVVADSNTVWIKNHPTAWSQWRCTSGGHCDNASVDDEMASGAMVLRVGTGA